MAKKTFNTFQKLLLTLL